MRSTEREKIYNALKLHGMWLAGEDGGEKADLSGTDMRNLNLRGMNLSYANLSGVNLEGANLAHANLSGASLADADLRGADMASCKLNGADLSGADLRGTDLSRAELDEAKLDGAIQDADTKIDEPVNEPGTGMDLIGYARNIAKIRMEDGVIVTNAQPGKTYEGEIISVHESGRNKIAVMALAGDRAIVHDFRDADAISGLEEGKRATLVTDAEGYSGVLGRDAETM
ncbi:MAG: pentapeptide repeat-containing protein [Synergistaceae bacterium]|jgi:hypothetical protein|nr:pentapeptide repeat-containing protein [Synergistaceae bacterium]